MKLFYITGACSLASHITLNEINAHFTLDLVDTAKDVTSSGIVFSNINPKKKVPALQLDTGEVLTEGVAILQYLADSHPHYKLAPPAGTVERAQINAVLNFGSSEYHKAFGPLFSNSSTPEEKEAAVKNVHLKLNYLNAELDNKPAFIFGEQFTIADAYLFVISTWVNAVGMDVSDWPNVAAFIDRVSKRKSVQQAMREEGLIS